ncbi:MAG: hypothetical protein ACTH2Q_10350 [Propionibacteriaceae bacterium]
MPQDANAAANCASSAWMEVDGVSGTVNLYSSFKCTTSHQFVAANTVGYGPKSQVSGGTIMHRNVKPGSVKMANPVALPNKGKGEYCLQVDLMSDVGDKITKHCFSI